MPPTANHWESAYLAPEFELARGWLRQLDTDPRRHLLRRAARSPTPLQRLAARQRDLATSPCPTPRSTTPRPPERRLILARPALPGAALAATPHWRVYAVRDPKPLVEPLGAAAAQRPLGRPPGLRPRRHPPRRVPRPHQLHPLLVDRPRQRLPPAPAATGPWSAPTAPASSASAADFSALGRRCSGTHRDLLGRPSDDLLEGRGRAQSASESGSSSSVRTRARNSAPWAP